MKFLLSANTIQNDSNRSLETIEPIIIEGRLLYEWISVCEELTKDKKDFYKTDLTLTN